ncbi:CzcE family metal-binding protein [Acidithiobacillus sp. MC2.1]|jgi:hypothetical protein|uniref:CzcE family metal-binding protein n=1 Tax=Acidithiobacillus sp. MC2.2 TaxID=2801579 RepID=UPI0019D05D75|nr:CzcE family metal-binding protein [Acidithiobacillus sp. MC2.2]MBN6746388.1 CzcE family metal-binding protein [Acidithiobacillus sp. MC2.2]
MKNGFTALMAGLLLATAAHAGQSDLERLPNGKSVYGSEVVQPGSSAKVVNVDDRNSLNVDCGDIITFRRGEKVFTWKFDSVNHRPVDLRAISPSGFVDKPFVIYVSRNEAERN